MLIFDIEKAFDRVWHQGLLYKMISLNYPHYLIKVTSSFLTDRTFQVKIQDQLSSIKNISWGVPQGAVMSPDLYNIYTSDPPQPINCETEFYADDTAIISSSRSFAVTEFHEYVRKWKIVLNTEKTNLTFFTK